MSNPKCDSNFRIETDGNIKVSNLDLCTDEQKEFFAKRIQEEMFRLWIEDQSRGQN
jgi:hypothetical protein